VEVLSILRRPCVTSEFGLITVCNVDARHQGRLTVFRCTASQLNSIRRSVSRESLIGLVVPLVLTRLDYCNAVLAGLTAHQLDRLQSVINAAARMIYRASQYDHVTSLLHWLRVPESIQFKLCALVYKCLNGSGPTYLADNLQQVTDVRSRRRLRSSLSSTLIVPVTRRPTLGD